MAVRFTRAPRNVVSLAALAAINSWRKDDWAFVSETSDFFKFDADSEDAHDGLDVIKPGNLLARKPGRWLRVKFKIEDFDTVSGALRETSGPTDLVIGDVADGELLKREGSEVVSMAPEDVVPTVDPGEVLGLPADAADPGPAAPMSPADLKTIVGVPSAEPSAAPTEYTDPTSVSIGVISTAIAGMRFMPDPGDKSQIISYGAGSITLARGGNNYTDGTDASGSYCRGKNTVGALVDFNTGGTGFFKGSHLKMLTMIVKTETVIPAAAGEFWFCGLSSATDPDAFPTPKVAEYAGFLFDYDDAGANIVAFTSNGVDATSDHVTKVDTGVAMAINTRYRLQVARTTTGWAFYIDGVRVAHILSASGHVPSDSTALKLHLEQLADAGGGHNGTVLVGGVSISSI